jgi:putative endonuclease
VSRAVGAAHEARAADHLERIGYEIVARNFTIRGGEIDLVARDGDTLCFVEVRARASTSFGAAEETVRATKQKRIALAARHYLAKKSWNGRCRFDVVAINGDDLRLIRDAFRL